jgi:tetratricopeptide (TPR) repeat protein
MGTPVLLAAVCAFAVSHVTASSKEDETAQLKAVQEEIRVLQREVVELLGTKKYEKAIETLQERGSKFLRLYGERSWPMAEVSSSLAEAYLACGAPCDKESDAAELYEKAALVKREAYGESDPQYAQAVEKAADAFVQVGEHKRALRHYKVLAKKVAQGLGEHHQGMKNVLMKLGECAMKAKKWKAAAKAFSRVVAGELSPEEAVDTRMSLSVALSRLTRHEAALEHAEAAKDLAAKKFSKTDLRYAKALNAVAGILERMDRDEEAVGLMREASDIVVKKLGGEDPMSVQAQKNFEGMQSHIRAKDKHVPAGA